MTWHPPFQPWIIGALHSPPIPLALIQEQRVLAWLILGLLPTYLSAEARKIHLDMFMIPWTTIFWLETPNISILTDLAIPLSSKIETFVSFPSPKFARGHCRQLWNAVKASPPLNFHFFLKERTRKDSTQLMLYDMARQSQSHERQLATEQRKLFS